MSIRPLARALVAAALVSATDGHALTVLTVGKQATFRGDEARVRIGRDPRLSPLAAPECGGDEMRVQLAAYPVATARLVAQDEVVLPCERWRKAGKGFVYEDETGAAGGVTKVAYSAKRVVITFGGPAYVPPLGPVGYLELWFQAGDTRFLTRFHTFARNDASEIVTRKVSKLAAEGEAIFWDVMHADDKSEAHMQQGLATLTKAAKKSKKDGRSPFLLGMLHLYRYGLFFDDAGQPTDASRDEILAASDAFAASGPLLWDGTTGDSRVPGFIAAAKFAEGFAVGDDALMDAGIADVQAAVDVNAFFNVFDLIPIIQALPASDPRWQDAFADVTSYLENPETLACLGDQPEICANEGLAPHNTGGSLVLFGDVYAKAGDLTQATTWYTLAQAVGGTPDTPWPFQAIADERVLDVENRVARYLDADPGNDDPVIGTQEETCATCHNR
jgi:hypothetical protein